LIREERFECSVEDERGERFALTCCGDTGIDRVGRTDHRSVVSRIERNHGERRSSIEQLTIEYELTVFNNVDEIDSVMQMPARFATLRADEQGRTVE
jgi:hypothetical protein